ncbi:hypothetical protein [Candidatus Harpocratesius sp.]
MRERDRNFLNFFRNHALDCSQTILIGVSSSNNLSFYRNLIPILHSYISQSKLKFILIGEHPLVDLQEFSDLKLVLEQDGRIETVSNQQPELFLIKCLFNSSEFITDQGHKIISPKAAIRGAFSSSKFLFTLRKFLVNTEPIENIPFIPNNLVSRLALLETAQGKQFFFAGVGIDEVNSLESKQAMILLSRKLFQKLGWNLHVGILSGGRLSDKGRDPRVDQTIDEARQLEDIFSSKDQEDQNNLEFKVNHYQILIEQSISDKANLLIAPDGISGNLIYRTLIHLGEGKSFGAIYLNMLLQYGRIIIDCSRVAPIFELDGAISLAAGLSKYF